MIPARGSSRAAVRSVSHSSPNRSSLVAVVTSGVASSMRGDTGPAASGRNCTHEREEADVRVTIIGAGNMARGVGTRVVAGGHELEILDRDPKEAQKLADELGGKVVVDITNPIDAKTGD